MSGLRNPIPASGQSYQLHLAISDDDADPNTLDRLTLNWMQDLRDLGVDSVARPPGVELPEAAKGDPLTVGTILVALVPALIPTLIEFAQDWVAKKKKRTIKIKGPDGKEVELISDESLSMDELAVLAKKIIESAKPSDLPES